MRISLKGGVVILAILILALTIGCDGDDDETPVSPTIEATATSEPEVGESVAITIGNHIDLTGPGANPMAAINLALADAVDYYNEEGLIPGVELKIGEYCLSNDTELKDF